jgi:hypothetical protein
MGHKMGAYGAWKDAFLNTVEEDDRQWARLRNLEDENRIPVDIAKFKDHLGSEFVRLIGIGRGPSRAAPEALDNVVAQIRANPGSPWFFLLSPPSRHGMPHTVVSYYKVSLDASAKRHTTSSAKAEQMTKMRLDAPLGYDWHKERGLVRIKPSIWVTWSPDARPLPDDPAAVKRELGLAHFRETDSILRFTLTISPAGPDVFVPTCLDACLYEAWAPPPETYKKPWGLTRDLSNGDRLWPELVVTTQSQSHVAHPEGDVVRSSRNGSTTIGKVVVEKWRFNR